MTDSLKLEGRKIAPGNAEGEALVSEKPISFYGGVDPDTGKVTEKDHDLEGQSITGKILVFPRGAGSTVGSYTMYRLKKQGTAPLAIILGECEPIVAVGAIISEIPCVDTIDISKLKSGMKLKVDATNAMVEVLE